MARYKQLAPIEIGKIRGALPYLVRHGVTLPARLVAAVGGGGKPPKVSAREVKRLIAILVEGPRKVSLDGNRFVIAGKRGRPPGRRSSAGRGGRKRPKATGSLLKARKLQGRYMGTLRGLKGDQVAQVKAAKAKDGYAAAFALAKKFKG